MNDGLKIAVVGATGAVGKEFLLLLEQRGFPVGRLILFASSRSQGKIISWKNQDYPCQVLEPGCFEGVQIAFFDASDAVSKEWAPQAAASGAWVVDNSATFRMDADIPLLVPEINGSRLTHLLRSRLKSPPGAEGFNVFSRRAMTLFSHRERILSGPNCSTVQLVLPLKAIQDQWGLKRVVVSTYQSTSGAGAAAMEELSAQTLGLFNQKPVRPQAFTHQIAFNCIPHIGGFRENGYTSEEMKIMAESRKILDLPDLKITATAVRVPTFSCHAESVNVECQKEFDIEDVRKAFKNQEGLVVLDSPEKNIYPMGLTSEGDSVESATGKDAAYVGRLRRDPSLPHALNFWVVADNLRKGAALNAIQIGELLVRGSAG